MMAVSIVLDYHDSVDGPIPPFLGGGGGINTVEWLDLGRSNLTGGIPDNLGTLPNLRFVSSFVGFFVFSFFFFLFLFLLVFRFCFHLIFPSPPQPPPPSRHLLGCEGLWSYDYGHA